ncbi:hypothetical protein [Bacillus mobilis]|uniref:hypothetical protein n=1 Tax=Bacillus mobilis TaxID=2026190 RepID=UPI00363ECC18
MEERHKSKPWQWPGAWMRDEKFWKDVASRTASGLLVVIIGLLYAGAAGYITQPDVRGFLIGFAVVALGWTVVFLVIGRWIAPYLSKSISGKDKQGIAYGIGAAVFLVAFCVFMVFVAIVIGTIAGH